jgi:hypothetical protein
MKGGESRGNNQAAMHSVARLWPQNSFKKLTVLTGPLSEKYSVVHMVHPFWAAQDEATKMNDTISFLKNALESPTQAPAPFFLIDRTQNTRYNQNKKGAGVASIYPTPTC